MMTQSEIREAAVVEKQFDIQEVESVEATGRGFLTFAQTALNLGGLYMLYLACAC